MLCTVLVAVGGTLLTLGLQGHAVALNHPALVGRTRPRRATESSVARSRPVRLWIPAIGLSSSLTTLGLNPDGTVQVPTSFSVPGWYRFGPSPGQLGSAVILGHVDSYAGPAIFYQLGDLKPGDRVMVRLADHRTVRFRVIGVAMYAKSHFPDRLVYGRRRYSALQLVTCGGVFDAATGHYLSNVVVFTELIAPHAHHTPSDRVAPGSTVVRALGHVAVGPSP